MWCFDTLFDVVHSAMGNRNVPRTEEASAALHMLGTPRWSYNAQKLFCIMLFPEILVCFFLWTRFITWELAFSFLLQHGYFKWLKTEVVSPGCDASAQESNWTPWLVSWLKREHWLAVAQQPSQTQKRHTRNQLLANLMPTCMHGIENNKIIKFWGERIDMIMSVAV